MQLSKLIKTFVGICCFMLLVLLVSNSLNAATTQGTAAPFASTGTVDVNVVTGETIRIFGLQTVNFGNWSIGDGNLADNQNVCIGKSDIGQPYAIQATGDGNAFDPSAFTITNGVDQINYDVLWTSSAGQITLAPGSTAYGQTGSAFSFLFNRIFGTGVGFTLPCGTGLTPVNANLEIRIPSTELSAAAGGFYTGVLTLLVIPN